MANWAQKVDARATGAEVSINAEAHVVGEDVAATVLLREVPLAAASAPVVVHQGATTFQEVLVGTPAAGQFKVHYAGRLMGALDFNAADNGKPVTVSYKGRGSNLFARDINALQAAKADLDGATAFTGPVRVQPTSSAAAPAIVFDGTTTGLYRAANGAVILAVNGADVLMIDGNGITVTGSIVQGAITGTSTPPASTPTLAYVTMTPASVSGLTTDTGALVFMIAGFSATNAPLLGGVATFSSSNPTILPVGSVSGIATRQGAGTATVTGSYTLNGVTLTATANVVLALPPAPAVLTPAFRFLPTKSAIPVRADAGFPLTYKPDRAISFPRDADTDGYGLQRTYAGTSAALDAVYPSQPTKNIQRPDLVSEYDPRLTMVEVSWPSGDPSYMNAMQVSYVGGGETGEIRNDTAGPVRTWAYLPDFAPANAQNVGKKIHYKLNHGDRFGDPVLDDAGTQITGYITLGALGSRTHVEIPTFTSSLTNGNNPRTISINLTQDQVDAGRGDGSTIPASDAATHFLCALPSTTVGVQPPSSVPMGARLSSLPIHSQYGVYMHVTTLNAWGKSDATGPDCTVQNAGRNGYSTAAILDTAVLAPDQERYAKIGTATPPLKWRRVTLQPGERLTLDRVTAGPLDLRTNGGQGDITSPIERPSSLTYPPYAVNLGVEVKPVTGQATLAQLRAGLVGGLTDAAGNARGRTTLAFDPILFARSATGPHAGARRLWGRLTVNAASEGEYQFVPYVENTTGAAITFDFFRPACGPTQFIENRMPKWHFDARPKPDMGASVAINNETYLYVDHRHYVRRDKWTVLMRVRLPYDPYQLLGTGIQKLDLLQGGPTGSASLGLNVAIVPSDATGTVGLNFNWSTQGDRTDLTYLDDSGQAHPNPTNPDYAACGIGVTALGQIPAYTEFDIGCTGVGRKVTGFLFGLAGQARKVVVPGTGSQNVDFATGPSAPVDFSDSVDDPTKDHSWQSAQSLAFWSDRDHTGQWLFGKAMVLHPDVATPAQMLAECAAWDADPAVGPLQAAPTDPLDVALAYPPVAGFPPVTSTVTLQTLVVAPDFPSLPNAGSQQFTVSGTGSDGQPFAVVNPVWSVQTPGAGSITPGGLYAASAGVSGPVVIRCTVGAVYDETTVTVASAAPIVLAASPSTTSVAEGATTLVTLTVTQNGQPVVGQAVTAAISAYPGNASVSPASGVTNSSGQFVATVTGSVASPNPVLTLSAAGQSVNVPVTVTTPTTLAQLANFVPQNQALRTWDFAALPTITSASTDAAKTSAYQALLPVTDPTHPILPAANSGNPFNQGATWRSGPHPFGIITNHPSAPGQPVGTRRFPGTNGSFAANRGTDFPVSLMFNLGNGTAGNGGTRDLWRAEVMGYSHTLEGNYNDALNWTKGVVPTNLVADPSPNGAYPTDANDPANRLPSAAYKIGAETSPGYDGGGREEFTQATTVTSPLYISMSFKDRSTGTLDILDNTYTAPSNATIPFDGSLFVLYTRKWVPDEAQPLVWRTAQWFKPLHAPMSAAVLLPGSILTYTISSSFASAHPSVATQTISDITSGMNLNRVPTNDWYRYDGGGQYIDGRSVVNPFGLPASAYTVASINGSTAAVASVQVSPVNAQVIQTNTLQYTATGYDSTNAQTTGRPTTWDVSPSGAGAINASTGLFTPNASYTGNYTVGATMAGIRGTTTGTVVAPAAGTFTTLGRDTFTGTNSSGNTNVDAVSRGNGTVGRYVSTGFQTPYLLTTTDFARMAANADHAALVASGVGFTQATAGKTTRVDLHLKANSLTATGTVEHWDVALSMRNALLNGAQGITAYVVRIDFAAQTLQLGYYQNATATQFETGFTALQPAVSFATALGHALQTNEVFVVSLTRSPAGALAVYVTPLGVSPAVNAALPTLGAPVSTDTAHAASGAALPDTGFGGFLCATNAAPSQGLRADLFEVSQA